MGNVPINSNFIYEKENNKKIAIQLSFSTNIYKNMFG
jgi:hypothetical protein